MLSTVVSKSEAITQTPRPPRRCVPLDVKYCGNVNYNYTSYPNILGHENIKDVDEDFISFRELVDAECYRLAYEFVCQVLQSDCQEGAEEDEMIWPCRSFCRDFMAGCGGRLLPKFKELMDCSRFPEFGESTCVTKPGKKKLFVILTLTCIISSWRSLSNNLPISKVNWRLNCTETC